jgi:hypothetical protein
MQNNHYTLEACLPLVELTFETPILMGPVLFWPAFQSTLFNDKKEFFLPQSNMACLSLSDQLSNTQRDALLVDSVYLLYFAAIFREIYLNSTHLPFNSFTQIVKFEKDVKYQLEDIPFPPQKIHWINPEVCKALGNALEICYPIVQVEESDKVLEIRRLIRAIRFFVDRFYDKFHNPLINGSPFAERLFAPEDVIFLATSFEALFNISSHLSASDFKQKLRPILHLQFGKPISLFWNWVDGFYALRERIIHSGEIADSNFNENENFSVPYTFWGIKLFIYAVYYHLFKFQLLQVKSKESVIPIHFTWLHPEELLLFLWPEKTLLKKIALLTSQIIENPDHIENFLELEFLSNLYLTIQQRYFQKDGMLPPDVHYYPTPREELEPLFQSIIENAEKIVMVEGETKPIAKAFPDSFIETLQQRLVA